MITARARSRRNLGFLALASFIAIFIFRNGLFSQDFQISYDTPSYVNVSGLAAGASLSNFSSKLRAPGLSLFLAAATFGKLPRPDAITVTLCGKSIIAELPPCDQVSLPEPRDITLRKPPVVFSFQRATADQLQQVVTAAKLLLVASFAALFFALTAWLDPLLAAAVGAALWWLTVPSVPSALDVVMTECLFPALLFLYAAAAMASLSFRNAIWPLLASALVFYIFLVKPSLIYIVAIQIVLLAWLAWRRRSLPAATVASLPLLLGFGWYLLFSPTIYLNEASRLSEALRAAILSDEMTVACIPDAESKTIVRSYMYSAYFAPAVSPLDSIHNDVERYYALGRANAYRLNLARHPIYSDPAIRPFLTPEGVLNPDKANRAMHQAAICNRLRDLKFAVLVSQISFGLMPSSMPQIFEPRFFFAPYIFWLSVAALGAALSLAILRGDIRRWAIIAGLATIHIVYVAIVATKQGGESRYIMATEPVFILGLLFALAFLVETMLGWAERFIAKGNSFTNPAS
jgi:hypothetical protein